MSEFIKESFNTICTHCTDTCIPLILCYEQREYIVKPPTTISSKNQAIKKSRERSRVDVS